MNAILLTLAAVCFAAGLYVATRPAAVVVVEVDSVGVRVRRHSRRDDRVALGLLLVAIALVATALLRMAGAW